MLILEGIEGSKFASILSNFYNSYMSCNNCTLTSKPQKKKQILFDNISVKGGSPIAFHHFSSGRLICKFDIEYATLYFTS